VFEKEKMRKISK